jgi:spermidine synthase
MPRIKDKFQENQSSKFEHTSQERFPFSNLALFFVLPLFLFLLSGLCSLVYEVVWSRMLVLVMGNTTLATSTILASFMAGLSLGSWYWGRFIESHPGRPLAVFGGLEAGVGVLALLFPLIIKAIVPVEMWLTGSTGWGYYSQILIRFLFCFGLLIVPTFLMGGTFAVIGRHVIRFQTRFGTDTAILYGINTAGAVGGAFLAGFFLIKYLGHSGSLWLTAFLNLSVGFTAILMDLWFSGHERWTKPVKNENEGKSLKIGSPPSRVITNLVMLGLALSGFCSLAYEVLWTRLLILVIDNSIYSFTTILMAFLSGIALGSLLLAPLFKYVRHPVPVFALLQIGIAVSAFFFPFFIHLGEIDPNEPYWGFLLIKVPLLIFVPTILMGVSLPLAAHIYQARSGRVGESLGSVFAVNTIGGVCGALAACFLLIPVLGFQKSSLLLPALNLGVGGMILIASLRRSRAIPACAALILAFVMGVRYMPSNYFSLKYGELEPQGKLTYYKEGLATTASVFQRPDGVRILYLNGMPEVDTSLLSVRTLKVLGALPGLLHKDPESALMITFGVGITAGMAAHFVDSIDCVDLADQIPEIAPLFAPFNNNILEDKKFSLHIDDARHFLQNTGKSYSIIVSDATHPRSYDSWVLFTTQFYELVREKLKKDGIFCQWVPFHGLSPKQYMGIVRTFSNIFPHTSIWRFSRAYSLLLATPEILRVDFSSFLKRMLPKDIQRDLMQVDIKNPFKLLSHFALGEEQVRKMITEFPETISDNSPAHLFFPPTSTLKEQHEQWPEINFQKLRAHSESIIPYLTNISRSEDTKKKVIDAMRRVEMKKTW